VDFGVRSSDSRRRTSEVLFACAMCRDTSAGKSARSMGDQLLLESSVDRRIGRVGGAPDDWRDNRESSRARGFERPAYRCHALCQGGPAPDGRAGLDTRMLVAMRMRVGSGGSGARDCRGGRADTRALRGA
jgi:hypothetical protein